MTVLLDSGFLVMSDTALAISTIPALQSEYPPSPVFSALYAPLLAVLTTFVGGVADQLYTALAELHRLWPVYSLCPICYL